MPRRAPKTSLVVAAAVRPKTVDSHAWETISDATPPHQIAHKKQELRSPSSTPTSRVQGHHGKTSTPHCGWSRVKTLSFCGESSLARQSRSSVFPPRATVLCKDFTLYYDLQGAIALFSFLDVPPVYQYESICSLRRPAVTYTSIFVPHNTRREARVSFRLGADAAKIAKLPNAGGKSTVSEALSMELFNRSLNAHSVVTEMEVVYWSSHWKKVDYICTMFEHRVGVSVTRAMKYPDPSLFTDEDAQRLLRKKLYGLVVARQGIADCQRYDRSVLHVWCQTARIAIMVRCAFLQIAFEMSVEPFVALYTTVATQANFLFYDDVNVLV